MPYRPEHREKTRAKIVTSARALFNRRGFEQVTIDEIMAHAGLTRGGFYHHFDSKESLYVEAVSSASRCSPFARELGRGAPRTPAERAHLLVDMYLADDMLANVDEQCPLYALPSDAARAGRATRVEYTRIMERMIAVFRGGEREVTADEPSFATLALCVGAMVLARTTQDSALARDVRTAARAAAHDLLAPTSASRPRRDAPPANATGRRRENRRRASRRTPR